MSSTNEFEASGTTGSAREQQGEAASLLGDLKSGLGEAAEKRGDEIAESLEDAAEAVSRSAEQLQGHQDWIADLVESGADELKSLAATVRDKDFKGLVDHVEDLARRQPAVFLGAAMAAGFAMVRLGKAGLSGQTGSSTAGGVSNG